MLFSVAGAVLISDPQATVSAGTASGASAYLGYVFPLLSGVSLGFHLHQLAQVQVCLSHAAYHILHDFPLCHLLYFDVYSSSEQWRAADPGSLPRLYRSALARPARRRACLLSDVQYRIAALPCCHQRNCDPSNQHDHWLRSRHSPFSARFRTCRLSSELFITLLAMVTVAVARLPPRSSAPHGAQIHNCQYLARGPGQLLSHLSMQSGRTHLARSFGSEQCRHPRLQQRRNSELCRHS